MNIANLLLARGTVREREMAIRASMGASNARLIRQVLTESLLLAALGGMLGILLGAWLFEGLLAVIPRGLLPAEADPRLNMPVLMFALVTTTACGLLFGSAPAWQVKGVDLNEALKQSSRTSASPGRRRLRHALVVIELALAVTSLTGAGLAIYSFRSRMQVDLGISTDHTLTFSLPVSKQQLNTRERIESFYRQLLDRLRAAPGVAHASLRGGRVRRQILPEGATLSAGGLALGAAGAHALGRAMQSTLFGTGAMRAPVLLSVGAGAPGVGAYRVLRAGTARERRGSDDRLKTGMTNDTGVGRAGSPSLLLVAEEHPMNDSAGEAHREGKWTTIWKRCRVSS